MLEKRIKNKNLYVEFIVIPNITYVNKTYRYTYNEKFITICKCPSDKDDNLYDARIDVLNSNKYLLLRPYIHEYYSNTPMIIKEIPLSYFYPNLNTYLKESEIIEILNNLNNYYLDTKINNDSIINYIVDLYKKEKLNKEELNIILKDELLNYIELLSNNYNIEDIYSIVKNNINEKVLKLVK